MSLLVRLFGKRPKTFPKPSGPGAGAILFMESSCMVKERGFGKTSPAASYSGNYCNFKCRLVYFLFNFVACTSFVWFLNIAVVCVFSFQLWGYFFIPKLKFLHTRITWKRLSFHFSLF